MSDGNVTAPVKVDHQAPQLMDVPQAFYESVHRPSRSCQP